MEKRLIEGCAAELRRWLATPAQIVATETPGPDRIEMHLAGGGDQGARVRLAVDLRPARAAIYLAAAGARIEGEERPLRSLEGRWILAAEAVPGSNILRLRLRPPAAAGGELWLLLDWRPPHPSCRVVEPSTGRIVDRWPPAREDSSGMDEPALSGDDEAAAARRGAIEEASVRAIRDSGSIPDRVRVLRRAIRDLPACLAHEALERAKGDPGRLAAEIAALLDGRLDPRLYLPDGAVRHLPPAFVSPLPLASLAAHEKARRGDLLAMIGEAHRIVLEREEREKLLERLDRAVDAAEKRLLRLHRKVAQEIAEAAEGPRLRRMAEAILIHIGEIPAGSSSFRCPDPTGEASPLTIPLDPARSPAASAERYFRLARRLERSVPIRKDRLRTVEISLERISRARREKEEDPDRFARRAPELLRELTGGTTRSRRESRKGDKRVSGPDRLSPRMYKTSEDWTVLVGRSNEGNDHLTYKIARPDDYWFHAQGCPGSHVILRREGRRDNPSRRTIQEAASIAAHFSKARTSRKVPVLFTLRKYVRKPRGGAPGLAVVTHEKMVMVPPIEPREERAGE